MSNPSLALLLFSVGIAVVWLICGIAASQLNKRTCTIFNPYNRTGAKCVILLGPIALCIVLCVVTWEFIKKMAGYKAY